MSKLESLLTALATPFLLAAGKKAAEVSKDAQKQAKKAQKAVSDVTANITLGDN